MNYFEDFEIEERMKKRHGDTIQQALLCDTLIASKNPILGFIGPKVGDVHGASLLTFNNMSLRVDSLTQGPQGRKA